LVAGANEEKKFKWVSFDSLVGEKGEEGEWMKKLSFFVVLKFWRRCMQWTKNNTCRACNGVVKGAAQGAGVWLLQTRGTETNVLFSFFFANPVVWLWLGHWGAVSG